MANPLDNQDNVVLERTAQKIKPPPLYQVLLLNDDYTPMEFVIGILQLYFSKNLEAATAIMLKVHQEGKGVCGVYTKDVAQTKVDLVSSHAKQAGHPLQCVMEEA